MPGWTDEGLRAIYDTTSGKCHLCHKKLAWKNYGARKGTRGAWHVDHSRPLTRGGVDDRRNAKPACASCNCSKQDGYNRTIRARRGLSRAPLSRVRRKEATFNNTIAGAGVGAALGGLVGGRPGAILGGVLASLLGAKQDPDKRS